MIFSLNIDHIATIRNARKSNYPNLLRACEIAKNSGAQIITIHLREDRRHINDEDANLICNSAILPVNLEIAPTLEMITIATKLKPNFVAIVPEKREEITTEGGMNLEINTQQIKSHVNTLNAFGIEVSCFINPCKKSIILAKEIGFNTVELHTGEFSLSQDDKALSLLKECAYFAKSLGLNVHAGHGLNYISAYEVAKIQEISTLHIGHFVITESIFLGLEKAIKKMIKSFN